jgi:hypothetical protein
MPAIDYRLSHFLSDRSCACTAVSDEESEWSVGRIHHRDSEAKGFAGSQAKTFVPRRCDCYA